MILFLAVVIFAACKPVESLHVEFGKEAMAMAKETWGDADLTAEEWVELDEDIRVCEKKAAGGVRGIWTLGR